MATTPNFGSQAWHRKGAEWEKAGVRESIENRVDVYSILAHCFLYSSGDVHSTRLDRRTT